MVDSNDKLFGSYLTSGADLPLVDTDLMLVQRAAGGRRWAVGEPALRYRCSTTITPQTASDVFVTLAASPVQPHRPLPW